MLERLISEIYLPVLSNADFAFMKRHNPTALPASAEASVEGTTAGKTDALKSEFVISMFII